MAARIRGRYRRGPLLIGVLVIAVVSGVLLFAWSARPTAEPFSDRPSGAVAVEDAHVGTAYAFDGVVCLGSQVAGSTVLDVEVEQAPGGTTAVVQPPPGPLTLGFPVDPDDGSPAVGFEVPAGELDCSLRVLVTPEQQGTVEAGRLRFTLGYGPGELLRRTVAVQPRVSLDVTRTGPDPRAPTS